MPRSIALLVGAVFALLAPAAAFALIAPAGASARILHVGSGQRYRRPCQAIAVARPGDQVWIDARGNRGYRGDVCAWSTNRLTIIGVHGRAHIDAAGHSSQGKAIWVIAGNDTTIRNVEFSGARVPDQNGAGIRFSHNIYINHVRTFTLRYSYSTDAFVGHLVKSRALRNYILYDRLTGEHGDDSYELDLPNGGLSYVIGTVIQQGTRSPNSTMLAYGEEGVLNPDSRLYAINDTFVNDLGRGDAIFVAPSVSFPAVAENDISVGSPVFVSQRGARMRHDCLTRAPAFVDPARYDYRLQPGSPCRRAGVRPGSARGFSLVPRFQYVPVAGHVPRTDGGTIAGAFGSPS